MLMRSDGLRPAPWRTGVRFANIAAGMSKSPNVASLAEAIAANVRDGDTVALEGFTHLIPSPPATRSSARAAAT